jgi:hypothetical protein
MTGVLGVIAGALELPLLLLPDIDESGEKASSGRRRSPWLGRTTARPPGGVGAEVGWCRMYEDCC